MKATVVIEGVDNGLIVRGKENVQVLEKVNEKYDNIYAKLGVYLYKIMRLGMNELQSRKIRVEINITNAE
jgi:hypothetical protein